PPPPDALPRKDAGAAPKDHGRAARASDRVPEAEPRLADLLEICIAAPLAPQEEPKTSPQEAPKPSTQEEPKTPPPGPGAGAQEAPKPMPPQEEPRTEPGMPARTGPPDFEPFESRWDIEPPPYEINKKRSIWNPYEQNQLKGDYPIIGQDIF